MKTKIVKMEQVKFYDLSHILIAHMCYWTIHYSTGTKRTVKVLSNRDLPEKAQNFYETATAAGHYKGFYAESAYTETTIYRAKG